MNDQDHEHNSATGESKVPNHKEQKGNVHQAPVTSLDAKPESTFRRLGNWVKDHPKTIIVFFLVLAIGVSVSIMKPWEDPLENQESVAPERSWNTEQNSQEYLPEARVIDGQGESTMTMPDNEQNGALVSFDIIGIDAVGDDNGATLAPPQEIDKIGHYVRSPHAGKENPQGSALYTSHVNYAGAVGVGAVWTSLKNGDPLTFTDAEGVDHHYTVKGDPFRIDKSDPNYVDRTSATINDFTSTDGRVVLVSCGGDFVGGALGYEDNVFVVAYPADRP